MKMKKVAALLMSAVMMFSLTACSGGDTGNSSSTDSTDNSSSNDNTSGSDSAEEKITIWAWDESFNIVAANQAKEIYEADNPGVEVEVVTMAQDDIVAQLNTSLAAGSYDGLPNIVLIEDYRIQGYLTAYEDEFAELSSVVNPADFASYKTGVNQIDGTVYGAPFDSGVAALFYRKDLIEAAGYSESDMEDITWEEYIEIGVKVKEETGIDWATLDPSDIGQIRIMMQSAGSWYTDEKGNVDLKDNQALKDAMKIYTEWMNSGTVKVISDWDQFTGAFNGGEVASVVTGCWIAPSIQNEESQSGDWGVAAVPRMGSNSESVNASSIGGAGWYVLKNTGNADTAIDFIGKTFASDTDLMNTLAEEITLVSTLLAAAEESNYSKGIEFFGGQELFGDFAEWTEKVPVVNYGNATYEIEDMMTEALQAVVNGADIDTTLSDYQTQAEAAVTQ